MHKIVVGNESEMATELAALIENSSNDSIRRADAFTIGVSGGSLIKILSAAVPALKTDLGKWKIFFCDERIVPDDSPDSTFGAYKRDLIGKTELREEQFVKIKQGVSAGEAASDYVRQMELCFGVGALPRFDMLLLGMGPDGHTCSLFPGHTLLDEGDVWVAAITDSPKPPPERITLTFPVINNARCCVFAIAGDGKADMVKRILVDRDDLPCTRVNPTSGELYWILDVGAAKHIN